MKDKITSRKNLKTGVYHIFWIFPNDVYHYHPSRFCCFSHSSSYVMCFYVYNHLNEILTIFISQMKKMEGQRG